MSNVLITGGTGMIGQELTNALLEKGYEVTILTRKMPGSISEKGLAVSPALHFALWDPGTGSIDRRSIETADHIVMLAGANVGEKRWTRARKKEILDSRVNGGNLILRSLVNIPNRVRTLVSASAIGWYGPDPSIPNPRPYIESDPAFHDFLGQTCHAAETSIAAATDLNKRVVYLRGGIVLSEKGGAFPEFRKTLRFGIASILGTGEQIVSWIHIHDLVRMYIAAIENEEMHGPYNAVSPDPVSNRKMVLTLARMIRKRAFLAMKVPSFVLRLVLGELSIEVLKSATVSSEKIRQTGFEFKFPELESALKDLVDRRKH